MTARVTCSGSSPGVVANGVVAHGVGTAEEEGTGVDDDEGVTIRVGGGGKGRLRVGVEAFGVGAWLAGVAVNEDDDADCAVPVEFAVPGRLAVRSLGVAEPGTSRADCGDSRDVDGAAGGNGVSGTVSALSAFSTASLSDLSFSSLSFFSFSRCSLRFLIQAMPLPSSSSSSTSFPPVEETELVCSRCQ